MDDNNGFRAVTPIRPAAAYIGGKRRLDVIADNSGILCSEHPERHQHRALVALAGDPEIALAFEL
jgi:hypothetical protein